MRARRIETLPNRYEEHHYVCHHVFPELTALCPVTKLPDFYTIRLSYEPESRIVELRSLKLYFVEYRNVEILHEEIANRVLDDFIRAVQPRCVRIEVRVNVRGGIDTTIVRRWSKERGDEIPTADLKIGGQPM